MIKRKGAFEVADVVCREWEQLTSLSLEGTQYSRMWIRDVNNYMAESDQ